MYARRAAQSKQVDGDPDRSEWERVSGKSCAWGKRRDNVSGPTAEQAPRALMTERDGRCKHGGDFDGSINTGVNAVKQHDQVEQYF